MSENGIFQMLNGKQAPKEKEESLDRKYFWHNQKSFVCLLHNEKKSQKMYFQENYVFRERKVFNVAILQTRNQCDVISIQTSLEHKYSL
jgi:hypothetical protein